MKKNLKKKGFLVDKITEDSFYENLLLGITSVLKSCQFVSQINLKRFPPATLQEITYWETINYMILPEDLKNFYLSTNGFSFSYKFQYDKTEDEQNYVIGSIEINSLSNLERVETTRTIFLIEDGYRIPVRHNAVHLLSKLEDDNCVVLARFNPTKPPAIWFHHPTENFYLLCEDFATYFRMCLAHLGAPGWQLAVLNASLPEWSSELLRILAPGIYDRLCYDSRSEKNVIDPTIFKRDAGEANEDGHLGGKIQSVEEKCKVKKKRETSRTPRRPKSKV